MADRDIQNGKRYKIHDLLTRFGGSQATNPRDKVFALLGLAASTRLGNGSGLEPTQAIINYTRSVQETFIHVAEVLIQQDASVDKLLAAGIGWKRKHPRAAVLGDRLDRITGDAAWRIRKGSCSLPSRPCRLQSRQLFRSIKAFSTFTIPRSSIQYLQ